MIMSPGARKLVLTIHIAVSVGWIGALAAYLALDVAAATSHDIVVLRAAYTGMALIVSTAIVPLAIAALLTGLMVALGTKWGLFRHYWVVLSLLLTTVATAVLLVETQTIRHLARLAADPATSPGELRGLPTTLAHSIGGTVVLLVVLALNMYKPRGMTRYGWRKEQQQRQQPHRDAHRPSD